MTVDERLIKVREQMNLLGLDAFVVLSSDPHCSEYPADHWKFREYLSGFNGSAGTLVVTQQYVGLWVDSRYYIQAEKQLRDTSIKIFRMGMPNVPTYASWLTFVLPSGSVVGVDGFTLPYDEYCQMQKEFKKFGIGINYKVNIIDEIFSLREELPTNEVELVDAQFVVAERREKLNAVRRYMQKNNITHYLVSALDDVAYILNMRGSDVQYNPLFYAYLIITLEDTHLYINPHKLTSTASRMLEMDGVMVSLYEHYEKNLSNLPEHAHVCYDPAKANTRHVKALPTSAVKIEELSIIERMKTCKSEYERGMMRDAHLRDGVAMVNLLYELDKEQAKGLDELAISEIIESCRRGGRNYIGPSFESIVAYADNSAIVHYAPSRETNKRIEQKPNFLLIDTGGQYNDGTTDITRTIALGTAEDWAQEKMSMLRSDYTLVLKSHITLARAVFPEGTNGMQLDTFARLHLWKNGLDFGHGSGHGVGLNLKVHEGPIHMSKKPSPVNMQQGMVISNEPGIYRVGKYGIRLENLMLCLPAYNPNKQFGDFLRFEILSYCPFDRKAIDVDLLTDNELAWLNNYHQTVYGRLEKRLQPEQREWLARATAPLSKDSD